jgi:TonB-dependent starch-binding outer membrane protein SusC
MQLTFERKLLRVMRLTSIILLSCCLSVAAKTVSQTVTYKGTNVALEKIFTVVEQQTGYVFIYNPALLDHSAPVTINAEEMPLEKFLQNILQHQQLDYVVKEKTIAIKPKEIIAPLQPKNELLPISGLVKGVDGKPIANVSVVVKGTDKGTTTDADGKFTIDVKQGDVLVVSSVGFGSKEIKINSSNQNLVIALDISSSPLDEVQVIAYGTTSKRYSTGNVGTVGSEDISKQPVSNPLSAMIGRIPGVFITQNTGVAGGAFSIQIRGRNSIEKGNDPLYVIDGVPYSSQLLPNLGSSILGQTDASGAGNALNFINIADIESISVLKDADATAIYGSRGANGVVLLTTKKGKAGKSEIALGVSFGAGKVPRKLDLLNTSEYLQLRQQAFINDGVPPDAFSAPDLFVWDTTRFTDWQKYLIGGSSKYTDISTTMSGGTSLVQYSIGTTYHQESAVFPGKFSDKKIGTHLNLNSASTNGKFQANALISYVNDNNNLPQLDLTFAALTLPPNAPPVFKDDGSLNWADDTWPGANPLYYTKITHSVQTSNLISNLKLRFQIAKGLHLETSMGYTDLQVKEVDKTPIAAKNPTWVPNTGSASFVNNSIRSWIVEPQISYDALIRSIKIELLAGTSFQQSKSEGQILEASGYNSDALLNNILAAPIKTFISVTNSMYKYNAGFGRVNVRWQEKYILNLTARRDGSSRFGKNNKFHNFGSVGAAWIFSDEKFLSHTSRVLSFAKLRGSVGTTGNDQIGYDLFNPSFFTYQGAAVLTPSNLNNPDLQWEETRKMEIGLDLGFFADRILISGSYYHNRASNQLLSYTLPTTTGFGSISANLPAVVKNKGLEFTLSTTNLQTKNWTWNTSANFTVPRNELASFPKIDETAYNQIYVVGRPLSINSVFHSIGVNDSSGVYEFVDRSGNRTTSPDFLTDRISIINTAPKFYGGLSNMLRYKNIQLDFTLQYTKQQGANPLFESPIMPGRMGSYMLRDVSDGWTKKGDDKLIQKASQQFFSDAYLAYQRVRQSDIAYMDKSFVRLKNVSITWQCPEKLIQRFRLTAIRVFLQGQNVLTFTKYKGLDPESGSSFFLPPLRMLTAGVKVSI